MASNHTTTIDMPGYGTNTQGFFSFQQPDNLIVFVHGFAGDALTTWNNFSGYLLNDPHFAKSDCVFYGYKTFKGQAGDHAAQLYSFLCLLDTPLKSGLLPANQNLPERNYKHIWLVAHSLGAILVRQAQLLGTKQSCNWVERSSLALFAPAHHGARVISLAMEALPGLSKLFGLFGRYQYPILNDLDSNEDGILKMIKSETKELQDKNKGDFSKAKLVVYAMGDKVVRNIQYLNDVPPMVVPEKSHISVCKPSDLYNNPVALLKSVI